MPNDVNEDGTSTRMWRPFWESRMRSGAERNIQHAVVAPKTESKFTSFVGVAEKCTAECRQHFYGMCRTGRSFKEFKKAKNPPRVPDDQELGGKKDRFVIASDLLSCCDPETRCSLWGYGDKHCFKSCMSREAHKTPDLFDID